MTDQALTITRDEAASVPDVMHGTTLGNKLTLRSMAKAINASFEAASKADTMAFDARISAGKMLLDAKAKVEAAPKEHGTFKLWYETNIKRSKADIYKVMKLASSPDPVAAREAEKEAARVGMERKREAERALTLATGKQEAVAAIEAARPNPVKSVWDSAASGLSTATARDVAVIDHASRYKAAGYELAKIVEADVMLLDNSVAWPTISAPRRNEIAQRLRRLLTRLEGMDKPQAPVTTTTPSLKPTMEVRTLTPEEME